VQPIGFANFFLKGICPAIYGNRFFSFLKSFPSALLASSHLLLTVLPVSCLDRLALKFGKMHNLKRSVNC